MKRRTILFFLLLSLTILLYSNSITLTDQKAAKFATFLDEKGVNPFLIVILLAMLPIFELRGSIPVGILALKLNIFYVIIFSIIGNMLPIFFILLFLKPLEKFLRKFKIFDIFFNWLFERTKAKSKTIEKYEELGLMLFVGIPLPLTGAWTGALAAYLFNLSYSKALLFIFFGVLIACVIVTALTLLWQLGALILGICILFFSYVTIKGIINAIMKK